MTGQGKLAFAYGAERRGEVTAFAGLPLYWELSVVSGLVAALQRLVRVRRAGWDDVATVLALVLLNLAGGTHVEDIERLEQDAGLRRLMVGARLSCLPRRERRRRAREWEKAEKRGEPVRAFPSPSSVLRYLERFHEPKTDELREAALQAGTKAFIVPETEAQRALWQVVRTQLAFLHQREGGEAVTLDLDATLVETFKVEALFCYKGFKSYQPLNFFWHELGTVVYSEFRDGNVPAGYQLQPALQRALEQLPAGVKRVRVRSDSAGYDWEFLRYLGEGRNERFGRIDFAVSADVTDELKKEVARLRADAWKPLVRRLGDQAIVTEQEWAEVEYVPNAAAMTKKGPTYRFLVTREPLRQLELPGVTEERQGKLPFPTMELTDAKGCRTPYKLHAVVTTIEKDPGDQIIWWLRERCGKSEEVHAVMKNDMAGGVLPSALFGANAAWWSIMLIALNLNVMMKRQVLGAGWTERRMKAVRFHLIGVAGRLVRHGRGLVLRLERAACRMLDGWRERIQALGAAPAG
jgi:hypothetical protein